MATIAPEKPAVEALQKDADVAQTQLSEAQKGIAETQAAQEKSDIDALTKQKEQNAPLNKGIEEGSARVSELAQKPIEPFTPPENTAKHVDPKVMADSAQSLMLLGSFFGLLSRQPFTASLQNMTAAMEGVQKGDEDQFKRSMEEWKTNFDVAVKKHDEAFKDQQAILNNANLDLTTKIQLLHVRDLEAGIDNKVRNAPFVQQMRVWEMREKAAQTAVQRNRDAMEAMWKQANAGAIRVEVNTGAGGGGIPQKTIDYYAEQSLSGDNSWMVGLARGGKALIAAVKDRIPAMAAERGMTPQDASTNKAVRDSTNKALSQRTVAVAAASQFIRQFDSQLALVEKYLDKGSADGVPIINKWIQAGRKSIAGDTDVAAFDAAIRGAAREHQRIVTGVTSNAQLHVSAQQTADELLNKDMTPAQIRATMAVMKEEAQNAVEAGKAEIEVLKASARAIGADPAKSAGANAPKPTPTDKDREIAKRSPEFRAKFKAHFGVDP